MITVRVTVLHDCYIAGSPVEAGTELDLDLLAADALIDGGRAALLDVDDAAVVAAARVAEHQRQAESKPIWGQSADAAAQQVQDMIRGGPRRNPMGFVWNDN